MLNANPLTALTRFFRLILAATIFIAGTAAFVGSSYAQEAVLDRTDVVKSLGESHGETTVAMGLAGNGGVLELLTSADGSTWTIIVTMPDGKSRIVGEGEAWMDAPLKPKGIPI
jgi:hypothetical protein